MVMCYDTAVPCPSVPGVTQMSDTKGSPQRYSIMVSAGEASSDMHAAHALNALQDCGVEIDCFGMGANKLADAGMELIVDCRDLAVIGIVDVLINYPRFMKRLAALRDALRARRPDLLLIVDYPDFNLKLAETARELGVPVLFYISPQVWAWRAKRVKRIGELVSHMAVLFPFEVEFYEKADIPVTYVGHPLVDDAHSTFSQSEAQQHFKLDSTAPVMALLPGSRKGELRRNLPVMLDAAQRVHKQLPTCQFILPCAPTLDADLLKPLLADVPIDIRVTNGDAYHAMRAADAVLSASGTATLETAMLGTPMAIVYVVNAINYALMQRLIQIDNIGLVNIVAGRRIVQEFVQHEAQPAPMATELIKLLTDKPYTDAMRAELTKVRERMGEGGASKRVAVLIKSLLTAT